ncbi:MAG: DUF5686 family protein [Prolixibacteraceae bacterium]
MERFYLQKISLVIGDYFPTHVLISMFILFYFNGAQAQTSAVSGMVIDEQTQEALPYVNIVIKHSTIGTMTDTLGHFFLKNTMAFDTLIFSAIGYFPVEKVFRTGATTPLHIEMKPYKVDLSEINVKMDEGPIRRLLQLVIDNKSKNNPDKYDKFSYNKYSKWSYQVDNVGDRVVNSALFKKNKSIFKSDEDSANYLPLYFSEQLVFNQVQKNPSLQKSTVIADRTVGVGVLGEIEISGYSSALDMEVNFYDNYLYLFSLNFVSPVANNGWFYYQYFLVDSTIVDGNKQYLVNYRPRRAAENTFKGYFIVENVHYSLVEIDGDLSSSSNLNYMKNLHLKSNYSFVNDSTPFYQRVQMDALFDYVPFKNPAKNKERLSLWYSQIANIDHVTINPTEPIVLNTPKAKYETIKLPGFDAKDSLFWLQNRREELTEKELFAISVIDSTLDVTPLKVANEIAKMSMTSYYDVGKFELGPFNSFVNTNMVEGVHLYFGGRTSDEISKNWLFWGGLGYGFLNEKISSTMGIGYKFPMIYRHVFKIGYDDKMIRMGENEKILNLYEDNFSATENNLVSQYLKHDPLDEIYREQTLTSSYDWEWYPGLSNKFSMGYTSHYSPQFYPFMHNDLPINRVSAFEIKLDTRLSKNEKVIDKGFLRMHMGTEFPIAHFTVGVGNVFYYGQSELFARLSATLKHAWNLGQTRLDYAIESGMYFGKLPYTMLDIPRGNETLGYYMYDFNMLSYLEFVHDKYFHSFVEYHLNGFFFRRIPVLKKANFREVLSAKFMVGTLSDKHQEIIDFPASISKMQNPYLELGAGVENILSFLHVEAIWRVRPESIIGAPRFGFRAKLEFGL